MDEHAAGTTRPAVDYSRLPERVAPEDLVTTQETDPAPDPTMGRDPETEFMLRHAGG